MYGKADDQTECGGADPAETEVREREICAHKVEHTIEVQGADDIALQACAEVIERGGMICSMPTVKEVVAQRGIAKNGPIVRYSAQVKK